MSVCVCVCVSYSFVLVLFCWAVFLFICWYEDCGVRSETLQISYFWQRFHHFQHPLWDEVSTPSKSTGVNLLNQWWTSMMKPLHLRWSFWKNLCKSWARFSEPSSFGWISMVGLRCEGVHMFFGLRCEAETESMESIFTFVWLARKYSNYHNIWKIVMIVWQGKQEESWTRHRYIPYHIIHYTTILFQSHSVGHAMPRIPWQKTLGKGRDQVVPRDKQLGCGAGLASRGNEYPLIHCTVSTMPTD